MCGLWNHGTFPQIKPFWGLTRGLRNLKKPFNEGGNVRQGLSCFISSNFPDGNENTNSEVKVPRFMEHLFFHLETFIYEYTAKHMDKLYITDDDNDFTKAL